VAVIDPVSDAVLATHHCLEAVDKVPGDSETTAFKRRARLQQAYWRESRDLKIGTQPMRPKPGQPSRPLGSRIELDTAYESNANFLNSHALRAVRDRIANPQPHQTLDVDRLYCDLLSSMPMCFNLFGVLQGDLELANHALHAWWPDVPGRVRAVHFEWSPGRRMPGQYLENRSAFDVAFELDLDNGDRGVFGIETKYHEDCKREKAPNGNRSRRYSEVTALSGLLSPEAMKIIVGSDLQQIWLDHLLALSMPQNQQTFWAWAGFALVHPARNPSYARATDRYRSLLSEPTSIRVSTIESLLAEDVLPKEAAVAFSERYLW
jgi:hypothetical protein